MLMLLACRGGQGHLQEKFVDSAGKGPLQAIVPESMQVPYDSSFLEKPLVACKLIHSPEQKEEDDFLHSNIAFFEVKSLPEQRFLNEEYCRFVLRKTNFLSVPESDFKPGNFKFSHFYTNIDHYGKCFVGKFFFPSAINAAQRRVVIIIQKDLKELSILTFDDIKFVDGKLKGDFNVRGKHFIYKLKYSKECKRFIQFN